MPRTREWVEVEECIEISSSVGAPVVEVPFWGGPTFLGPGDCGADSFKTLVAAGLVALSTALDDTVPEAATATDLLCEQPILIHLFTSM